MVDLGVHVGGLKLRSPLMAAAGPATETGQGMAACLQSGAAAVVARTVSVQPAPAAGLLREAAGGRGSLMSTQLWSALPVEQYVAAEYALAAGGPLVVSLGYSAEHVRALAPLVRPFAAAVELSTQFLADDPRLMADAVAAAKALLDVPIWVKLTALGRDVVAWARLAQEAGADAVVAMGGFAPCLSIDAERGAVAFAETGGYGWLSGPAVRQVALRCVWDIARQVDIDVIGCGGVARGDDVVEFMMAGAQAVQVCSAAIAGGPQVFGKISAELNAWLEAHGRASAAGLVGFAQRQLARRAFRTNHLPPVLDVDLCIGCEICPTSCVYDALVMVGERKTPGYKVQVIPERCWGCGICATRCPTRALFIEGVSLVEPNGALG